MRGSLEKLYTIFTCAAYFFFFSSFVVRSFVVQSNEMSVFLANIFVFFSCVCVCCCAATVPMHMMIERFPHAEMYSIFIHFEQTSGIEQCVFSSEPNTFAHSTMQHTHTLTIIIYNNFSFSSFQQREFEAADCDCDDYCI